jgi:signal transduction histidine kinase
VVFQELEKLSLGMQRCGIAINNKETRMADVWTTSVSEEGKVLQVSGDEPIDVHPLLQGAFDAWLKQQEYSYLLEGEDLIQYYRAIGTTNFQLPKEHSIIANKKDSGHPLQQFYFVAPFEAGNLFAVNDKDFTDEAKKIIRRFAAVFNLTYKRFLDLQKAEAQAKEAQIEAALERVRSRTMAMQRSDELLDASEILFVEMQKLGIESLTAGYVLMDKEETNGMNYTPDPSTKKMFPVPVIIPHDETIHLKQIVKNWKKGNPFSIIEMDEAETIKHQTFIAERSTNFTLTAAQLIAISPSKLILHNFYFKEGYLLIVGGNRLSQEQTDIMLRFTKVFQQTYTRFLDLQKAEEQARESQIQLALERVRARTMAMQRSEELPETSLVLYEQLKQLGEPAEQLTIGVVHEEHNVIEISATLHGGVLNKIYWHSIDEPFMMNKIFQAWKSQQKTLIVELKGDQLNAYNKYRNELTKSEMFPTDFDDEHRRIVYAAFYSKGMLAFAANEPRPPQSLELLERFASVFDLTYTRFNDLKLAEAQAREAQIEAALERIRGKVTSMQESSELLDIVVSMRSEFVALGHQADYFWYMRWLPEKYEKAMTSGDGTRIGMVMELPRHIHGEIPLLANWEKTEEPSVVYAMDVEAAVDYVDKMIRLGDFKQVDPQAPTLDDIRHIGGLTFVMARTTHGEIGYSLAGIVSNPPTEDVAVLVRFAAVFDLAYRRFEDLKNAEARNREAQIELAMERVRSRTMAMHKSEELPESATSLFHQMQLLGIPAFAAGYCIWEEDMPTGQAGKQAIKLWMSSEGILQPPFKAPTTEDELFIQMRKGFELGKELHVVEMGGEDLVAHYKYMRTLPVVGDIFNAIIEAGHPLPVFQVMHYAYFSKGFLLIITYEPVPDAHIIFKRFAAVFDQTYTRFLDLQQKEEQAFRLKEEKEKLEQTLGELQVTQKQLIQSEKMASLGELTAGIAHEIQNPLNFVNNFSDVSTELVDEMNEEIAKGNLEDAKQIAEDLKQNLEKINHHGKRAGDIVKGMLQHSRSSSATKESTDINKLADEYLRLAYHGLRAKDKTFNATMKTEFDETIGNINIIPQDIGRVILNLITNAFYVVNEKQKAKTSMLNAEGYEPTVIVNTSKQNGIIEIKVKDNGNGIPDSIKEKIFQPFFTTKPTGQGTGLGLSLSYDIVKAHGGEIKVTTKENEGTEFIIQLPIA